MRNKLYVSTQYLFVLLFSISHFFLESGASAQSAARQDSVLRGQVLDNGTNQPLAYANVGILDKPFGTMSDSNGQFLFSILPENLADTLQISLVGYHPVRICIRDFLADSTRSIKLSVRPEVLDEATVTQSVPRPNMETIGRRSVSKLVQVSVHNKKSAEETIGSEMGMLFSTRREGSILKDFNIYFSANNFNLIRIRINVYSVREHLPDTLLCNKQIIDSVVDFRTGWIKIDLEKYHIKVKDDFIITVQWIGGRMDKKENPITIVPVAVTPFSKNCYARIASQDKWKRMGVNLSSFVTIAY